MRAIGGLVSLVVVMGIGLFIYKTYLTGTQQALGGQAPTQVIDTIGVKNDLLSMAQAERVYQAQHSAYGSLDELVDSGAMAYKKTGRQGYAYDASASTDSFRITAQCTAPVTPGCINFAIDQTMEIQSTQ